jgi:hypothetical protein
VQPASDREEGAEALLDLLNDRKAYVQSQLPSWQLRHVFIPWGDEWNQHGVSFYYAPSPVGNAPATMVFRDNLGQWQIAQDERTSLPDDLVVLELTDLRLGPETAAQTFEAWVPGIDVRGIGLTGEMCELQWLVGGHFADEEGRSINVVEGVAIDSTGEFQLTDRYDFPAP